VFRERIKQAYDSLTPSFKRLAEFILNHELDVAFMTATELAKALGVDAATVVRFSQALGYRGYRELSHEIQQIVKADLVATYAGFDKAKTDKERLQALLENERHNLEVSVAQTTDKAAEMVDMLTKAQEIWVVGEASGRYLAELFAAYLRMAGARASAVDGDPAEAARVLWDLGEKDLVVGLGVPGTGVGTAAVLRFAKKQGAQTAAVSVSAVSPPAQVAEHVLICPSNTPLGLPSPASMTAMLMVLWQAFLARNRRMEERVTALQETYASLFAESVKQGQKVDTKRLWQEF
jgi:DNA-binding MurR/RpiR family transcriptional regulator